LPNRRRFDETSRRAVKSIGRTGKPLALLVVDADHFKRFNDRHGHAVGDEVLRGLARCLTASVHRPDDLAARVGGEEFALLLPDTDEEGAARIAAKVHETVATLGVASAGLTAGAVTVSIGLAVANGAGAEAMDDLYRRADAALYEAKTAGRNRTCRAPSAVSRWEGDKAAA
jgi:diguanylate cyclase (GGDEF)-like protein